MKSFTIRGVDEEIRSRLEQQAQQSGDSINTTMLKLLRKALQLDREKPYPEHHDLDSLAGTWSPEEREQFDRFQKSFEQIDDELWSS